MRSQSVTKCALIMLVAFFCCLNQVTREAKVKKNSHDIAIKSTSSDENNDNLTSFPTSALNTYKRTHLMRIYKLDIHSYRPELKFAGNPVFVDSNSTEHKKRCSRHLSHYKQLMDSFHQLNPTPDSIKLADVFGRPESGVLEGNQFWLGNYESCLRFSTSNNFDGKDNTQIKGQYCLGHLEFPEWNLQKDDLAHTIRVGLCLPETCASSMLNDDGNLLKSVNNMIAPVFNSAPFDGLELKHVYCLPHETSELRRFSWSAISFIVFFAAIATICVFATILDKWVHCQTEVDAGSSGKENICLAVQVIQVLSLTRNLEKLLHVQEDQQQNQERKSEHHQEATSSVANQAPPTNNVDKFYRNNLLGSLAGLKCLSLVLIISTHILLASFTLSRNLIQLDGLNDSLLVSVILASNFMPDTFFVISGLLASYLMFSAGIHKIKAKHWIALIIHRYWRLTPLYILVLWFTKSVSVYINSGPLWDYATSEGSLRRICSSESWTDAFLYLCDFKGVKEHCMPVAWFIANSIKFFMITPIFLTAIHKSMRFGYALTISALIANMVIVFKVAVDSPLNVKWILERKPEALDDMIVNFERVYLRPYSRVGPYLVGLLVGHMMYLMETNQVKISLSKRVKTYIWIWFSTTVTLHILAVRVSPSSLGVSESTAPIAIALIVSCVRPSWALCTCWFIFTMSTGQLPGTTRFLSCKFWQIIVRLSFSLYLVHCEVLNQIYLADKSYFKYTELVLRPVLLAVVSLFASLVVVLLFEYPLTGLEKILTGGREKLEEQMRTSNNDQLRCKDKKKIKDS